jgi:GPH family glycoside/pentoside/hexuronide:cation symporter
LNRATTTAGRTPLSAILIFAIGGLPLSSLNLAMAIAVQPYFAQELGVGLVTIALAFGVVRIIDLGVDLTLALAMDRTRTPIGRYRVWLMAGAPILMLGVYQLFMAKRGIGLGFLIVWLLVYALGLSIVTLARAAWSATLVTRYDERSRFYGVLTAVAVVGLLIAIATGAMADRLGPGWPNSVQMMGWLVLAMIPPCVALTVGLTPEQITPEARLGRAPLKDYWEILKKPELIRLFFSQFALTLGPGWMSNLYLFFFIAARGFTSAQAYILLGVYICSGILGAPLIGLAGARFSKHRTIMAATLCYSVGLCTVLLVPKTSFLLALPVMIWCGFMATGFDLMTNAMMADVGDQIRLEQGKERMALLFALTGVATKLAAAGAVIIAYPLLAAVGYAPTLGAHNSKAALEGLQWVFILGPIFFVVLGGVCFLGWRLDARRHAEIRRELEDRDTRLALSSARSALERQGAC